MSSVSLIVFQIINGIPIINPPLFRTGCETRGGLLNAPNPQNGGGLLGSRNSTDVTEIPDELWAIVQRMLARDMTERPENAGVAEEDLWAFLFRHGLRADANQLAQFMASTFPDEAKGEPGIADLQGLASDLRRLEGGATGVTDISTIEHNTPTHTSEKIMIPRLFKGNTGERKSVVVLMAEVTGFTELSASQDAADVVRWHYKLLRRLRRVVDRHGGLLENYQLLQ